MNRLALKACAAGLSALIVLLSPGPAAYAAGVQVRVTGEPGRGVSVPNVSLPSFSSVPSLPQTPNVPVPNAQVPGALVPAAAVQPQTAAIQSIEPAAARGNAPSQPALEPAGENVRSLTPILSNQAAAPEQVNAAAAQAFEGAAPKLKTLGLMPVAVGLTSSGAPRLSKAGVVAFKAKTVVRSATRATGKAVAKLQSAPKTVQIGLAAAAAVAAAVLLPYYASAAVIVPVVLGTCNSMQEAAIKAATIIPDEQDQARKALAKLELDQALVQFGKDLRKAAESDARVKSVLNSHDAEHALEEPLLEMLPKWKKQWTEGKGPTKEEAFAELRQAVLDRLQSKVLTREDAALVEELFDKTGGWDRLKDWEAKYDVLDALKRAAEAPKDGVRVQKNAGGSSSNSGQMGGTNALLAFVAFAGLSYVLGHLGLMPSGVDSVSMANAVHAFGGSAAIVGAAMLGKIVVGDGGSSDEDEPKQPKSSVPEPIALDKFLKDAGLDAEEIDFLKQFTSDIGAREMAPVIGRSKEIQRVITILSKPAGTQNNPMMLGDKGVGKTAIVEAVAKRLYENRLPSLKGKRILELDTGKLAAGTSLQGELEQRLTKLREIAAKTNNKVVLFIDEIHSLLKNNTTSNAVPDLLKAPLRNGEITVIGATTVGEYRKYMEKDPAFADRFDTVDVAEPTQDEAIEMLEGDLEYLEKKFEVQIDPQAAEAAVRLSARYIPEKFLPRKARLLLENAITEAKPAAARDGLQVQIDQLTDRLRILVRRYAALAKKGDEGDAGKRAEIIRSYNRVVAIYQTILTLEDKQRALREEVITREHIARSLAKATGLEIGDMTADDFAKLRNMEPWFKERVVGQDDAVAAVSEAVRRNKSGMADPDKPVGVFLFAGPTGVGKTEIARRLAEYLFNDPTAMVRIDMSEYMEKFTVQRLMGAPPGYVGYEEGGQLTEAVRRKPYSVVLLDEIEKAHDDVLLALLQVFEDGRMTDGKGNVVDFKNTIIIMTSNMGANAVTAEELMEMLKRRLRPEFINRIDKVVRFNGLDMSQAEAIVKIQTERVRKRLRNQDLELVVEPAATAWLAKKGFDPAFGARPIKRTVEFELAGRSGDFVLEKKAEGTLINGGVLTVDSDGEKLTYSLKPNPPPSIAMAPLPEGPLGAKLRNILEEAVRTGGEDAKDMRKFEAVLFPDRFDVELSGPLGAFLPETAAPAFEGQEQLFSLEAPKGERDPKLAEARQALSALTEGRWDQTRKEAAEGWLDAFTGLAKGIKANNDNPMVYVAGPDESAGSVRLAVAVDGTEEGYQPLLRAFRDHFTVPLADEGAVRKRAGDLKDEGKTPDRALLEVKRLVESVPGATFGFERKSTGVYVFWLNLPVNQKPAPPPPVEQTPAAEPGEPADQAAPVEPGAQAEPVRSGAYKADALSPNITATQKSQVLRGAGAVGNAILEAMAQVRAPEAQQDAARFWAERTLPGVLEATGVQDATVTTGRDNERGFVIRLEGFVEGRNFRSSGFYARQQTAPAELISVVEAIPGAIFGVYAAREPGTNSDRLTFWLRLPAAAEAERQDDAEPNLTALEARSTPGKMLRYLTPASSTRMGALRKLTADMLDAKGSVTRLLGLHLASSLVPNAAFGEIAGISRGVRVGDDKDAVLFADLSARAPTGMTAQRKTVRDTFITRLDSFLTTSKGSSTSQVNDSGAAFFSAELLDRLDERMTGAEVSTSRERAKAGWRNIRLGTLLYALLNSGALAATFSLYHWADWNKWIMLAVSAGATLWIWTGYRTWRGNRSNASRYAVDFVTRIVSVAGPKSERRAIARSWLERASRGVTIYPAAREEAAKLIVQELAGSPDRKLYFNWLSRVEKTFANPKLRGRLSSQTASSTLATLGLLNGALKGQGELQRRATAVMLAPVRERWMPADSAGYSAALGAWLRDADLESSDVDAAIDALTSYPLDSRSSTWNLILAPIAGLAERRLTAQQRSALDQLVSGLAAESIERNASRPEYEALIEAARIRAKLGLKAEAWETLKAPLSAIGSSAWTEPVMIRVAELIAEVPPRPLDRAWLEPKMRDALGSQAARPATRLALARLTADPTERITLLISALTEATLTTSSNSGTSYGGVPLVRALLDDLHAAVAKLRAEDKAQADEIDRAVQANLKRLGASDDFGSSATRADFF